jgi:enoyl-CoA hydratase/carnithine racemase
MSRVEDGVDLQTVQFDVDDGHVATITLDRPDVMNAFNERMAQEFHHLWDVIRDTDDIRAVVLRANGDRAFCTGIDRRSGAWWQDQNIWNQEDPGTAFGPRANRVWKPVVVAIHGLCAGGAQYFLNEADILICSDDATFFDPHANAGIVSALEPIGMLARGVPLGDVLRWALVGNEERISADTALRLGLVSEVLPRDKLWERAQDLASRIAARRPEAVQGTIRAIWEAVDLPRTLAIQRGLAYTHIGNDLDYRGPLGVKTPPEIR